MSTPTLNMESPYVVAWNEASRPVRDALLPLVGEPGAVVYDPTVIEQSFETIDELFARLQEERPTPESMALTLRIGNAAVHRNVITKTLAGEDCTVEDVRDLYRGIGGLLGWALRARASIQARGEDIGGAARSQLSIVTATGLINFPYYYRDSDNPSRDLYSLAAMAPITDEKVTRANAYAVLPDEHRARLVPLHVSGSGKDNSGRSLGDEALIHISLAHLGTALSRRVTEETGRERISPSALRLLAAQAMAQEATAESFPSRDEYSLLRRLSHAVRHAVEKLNEPNAAQWTRAGAKKPDEQLEF